MESQRVATASGVRGAELSERRSFNVAAQTLGRHGSRSSFECQPTAKPLVVVDGEPGMNRPRRCWSSPEPPRWLPRRTRAVAALARSERTAAAYAHSLRCNDLSGTRTVRSCSANSPPESGRGQSSRVFVTWRQLDPTRPDELGYCARGVVVGADLRHHGAGALPCVADPDGWHSPPRQ
jgi:hypothetical protein